MAVVTEIKYRNQTDNITRWKCKFYCFGAMLQLPHHVKVWDFGHSLESSPLLVLSRPYVTYFLSSVPTYDALFVDFTCWFSKELNKWI